MAVLLLLLIHFSAGKTSHITNTLFGCHTVAIESEESVQLQIHSWLTWCSPTSPPLLSLSRGSLYYEGAGR